MDLSQEKPTRSEWQNLEIPVSDNEKRILKMLMAGYHDLEIQTNSHLSLATHMKMTPIPEEMEMYIYSQFFQETIQGLYDKLPLAAKAAIHLPTIPPLKKLKIKKSDMIRIDQMKAHLRAAVATSEIYDFILLRFLDSAIQGFVKGSQYTQPVYTLVQIQKNATIPYANSLVLAFVQQCVDVMKPTLSPHDIVIHAVPMIERNAALIHYADITLYSHQKDLFRLFAGPHRRPPQLILYTAPTGTGKTMSPLALAQNDYRVIFLCSARHIGLGLAKAAISMNKRIAFAYGCNSAEDIRLHNFAAIDYTVNKKSGAIVKVDNSNGSKVEIMICDLKSYLIAMNYMLEFHTADSLIMYWDEPTITLDYETHPLHDLIHRNWCHNVLPNIVLSCATLPKPDEIAPTLDDFQATFENGQVHTIVSHDFQKSISILDADNRVVLPHLLFHADPIGLQKSVEHLQKNKTMLRYLDLAEIVRFLQVVLTPEDWAEYFPTDISQITMKSIKSAYLRILAECVDLSLPKWSSLLIYLKETQPLRFQEDTPSTLHKSQSLGPLAAYSTCIGFQEKGLENKIGGGGGGLGGEPIKKLHSMVCLPPPTAVVPPNPFAGILFTTTDAKSLTDGPTIYLADNVEKLGLFYIKQTQFPVNEMSSLLKRIQNNQTIQKNIQEMENQMEDSLGKENLKEKKMSKEQFSKEVKILKSQMELQRSQLEKLHIRPYLVPNSWEHLEKWAGLANARTLHQSPFGKPFTNRIEEADIFRIMKADINETKKILLLLGIGMFSQQTDPAYLEIIKELANDQKLFLIIASTDYIYGTNYQFCHGILGKDLTSMTQQKMIQALGRVGRNNIQQDYTVRFRNPELLRTLFLPMESNLEAINMKRLFMK